MTWAFSYAGILRGRNARIFAPSCVAIVWPSGWPVVTLAGRRRSKSPSRPAASVGAQLVAGVDLGEVLAVAGGPRVVDAPFAGLGGDRGGGMSVSGSGIGHLPSAMKCSSARYRRHVRHLRVPFGAARVRHGARVIVHALLRPAGTEPDSAQDVGLVGHSRKAGGVGVGAVAGQVVHEARAAQELARRRTACSTGRMPPPERLAEQNASRLVWWLLTVGSTLVDEKPDNQNDQECDCTNDVPLCGQ